MRFFFQVKKHLSKSKSRVSNPDVDDVSQREAERFRACNGQNCEIANDLSIIVT